jgi:type II secretion system protein C
MYQIKLPKLINEKFSRIESTIRQKGFGYLLATVPESYKASIRNASLAIGIAYFSAIVFSGILFGFLIKPANVGQIVPTEVTSLEDSFTPINHSELRTMILDRNLFNLDGKVPEESEAVNNSSSTGVFDPQSPCEKTTLPVALVGTIYMGKDLSFVTLRETGYSEADIYRPGDKIVGFPNSIVYAVERKKVIINNEGRKECIELDPDPNQEKNSAGKVGGLASSPSVQMAAISGGSVTLESSWVEKELGEGFSKVLQAARLVPNISQAEGKMNGFKIFAIDPSSILNKVGLQNDDVITRVNDISMTQPDQGFAIYQALQDEREISIHVLRGGKTPVTLNVKIK